MNLKEGQIWVCNEPYCAAEIEVKRAANTTCHGNFTVRCCCGKEMALKGEKLLEPAPARATAKVG